jgi:hypothetical protein
MKKIDYEARAARWKAPQFEDIPEMDEARRREVERDFKANDGLVTLYAMRTDTYPIEAARDLVAAGCIKKDDPILLASMDNDAFLISVDSTRPGGEPFEVSHHNRIDKATFEANATQGFWRSRFDYSEPASARTQHNRELKCIVAATKQKFFNNPEGDENVGSLAPSYERAARAIQKQWETGGAHDRQTLRAAKEVMTEGMICATQHIHAERCLEARQSDRTTRIRDAALRMVGSKRAPQKPLRDQLEI